MKFDCNHKSFMTKKRAFTLVEILVVIVIISILIVATIASLDTSTNRAKEAGVLTDIKALQTAAHQVGIEQGELTSNLNDLTVLLNKNLDEKLKVHVEGDKLKTDTRDPWGTEYELRYTCPNNTKGQLVILSAGPDLTFNTKDDIASTVTYFDTPSGSEIIISNKNESVKNEDEEKHLCSYTLRIVDEKYLNTAGNCQDKATYFYSCSCGKYGPDTFEDVIDPNTHLPNPDCTYSYLSESQHNVISSCAGCGVSLDTVPANHNYNNNTCIDCGYVLHVHDYSIKTITDDYIKSEANCNNPAVYYYACSCGGHNENYTYETGSKLGHNYIGNITTPATCTSSGERTFTCSRCSHSYTEGIDPVAHSFTKRDISANGALVSVANCDSPAKYYYSCASCGIVGNTYTFTNGEEDYTNHIGSTSVSYSEVDPTHHTTTVICLTCNKVKSTSTDEHQFDAQNKCELCNSHTHNYNLMTNEKLASVANCKTKDTYYYECLCGEYGTNTYEDPNSQINANNHLNPTPVLSGVNGVHSIYECCGSASNEDHTHTGTVTTSATCTSKGITTYTCACGDAYTLSDIETIPHVYNQKTINNDTLVSAATCTAAAVYNYSCSCGLEGTITFTDGEALGHTEVFGGGIESIHSKCSVCGETLSTVHRYTEKVSVEPTCTSKGSTTYTCDCGYNYTLQNIDALGHIDADSNNVCDRCNAIFKHIAGLGDVIIEGTATSDVEIKYDSDTGNVSGLNPTDQNDFIIPESEYPEIITFVGGTFEETSIYTPSTKQLIEYEYSKTRIKEPVENNGFVYSFFYFQHDNNGEIIYAEPRKADVGNIPEQYSTYIVYVMDNSKQIVINGVAGDSMEIREIVNVGDDTLENAIYLAGYLNMSYKNGWHVAKLTNGSYVKEDVDDSILAMTIDDCIEEYLVTGNKLVDIPEKLENVDLVYVPLSDMKAIKGMTWTEWLESDYNTLVTKEYSIRDEFGNLLSLDSVIEEGKNYGVYYVSLVKFQEPGLYSDVTCSETISSWSDLISTGKIKVNNGVVSGNDKTLDGVLILPSDGSVTAIGNNAFENYENLDAVILSDLIKTIGNYAFYNCKNLLFVDLGNGVESINECAFRGCQSLKGLTFPDSLTFFDSSGGPFLFTGISYLILNDNFTAVPSMYGAFEEFVVPEGYTDASGASVYGIIGGFLCQELYLPSTITYIGEKPTGFSGKIFQGIGTIYFAGTEEQWNAIPNVEYVYANTKIVFETPYPGPHR